MGDLESHRLLDSLFNGAAEVILRRDELNSINVFPVADGDTGSNLASLMQAVLDNVSQKGSSIQTLLDDISSAALIGARGNSGIIFAQYLSGVAESYQQSEIPSKALVQAFQEAVSKAYEAVLEPKEGTILSVISAWAQKLAATYEKGSSLEQSLIVAQNSAEKALIHTQFQMVILRKNRLVDSGAKGFYYFITGFTDAYCNQVTAVISTPEISDQAIKFENHAATTEPVFRYCSEFILNQPSISQNQLKHLLKEEGNSIVVAGNSKKLKVHLHTNNPGKVLALLETYGRIMYQKVDDMQLQYQVTTKQRLPIAIVTDSIADLPEAFILKHQIHVLPINILTEESSYLDKLTINPEMIKEKQANGTKMSTAQPDIRTIDSLLSFLESKYKQVLVITVSSKLSGTYQLMMQRIKEKQLSKDWIQVIDSRNNSVAQGLLVKKAVQLIEDGHAFEKVVEETNKTIERLFIYVAVADLSPMIQSGRIPSLVGSLAQRLKLFPTVSLDDTGQGSLSGLSFSQQQSIKKIVKNISKLVKDNQLDEIAVAHVCAKEQAEHLEKRLRTETGQPSIVVDSSAAIAISAGIGSIAIAGIKKERTL